MNWSPSQTSTINSPNVVSMKIVEVEAKETVMVESPPLLDLSLDSRPKTNLIEIDLKSPTSHFVVCILFEIQIGLNMVSFHLAAEA